MKQIKKHDLPGLDLEDVKVDELIASLQALKEKYSDYHDLTIDEESYYEGGYHYQLVGYKLETDAEEQAREQRESTYVKQREENERRQYEELKAKFEKP
jgi:hypothetical protein